MQALHLPVFPMLIAISMQIHAADSCSNLDTQLEINACTAQEYQREDAKLNKNYKELVRKLDPSEKGRLKAVELAWIKFRDGQCELEASRYEGGSIQPLIRSSCLTRMTKQRNTELKAMIEDASR